MKITSLLATVAMSAAFALPLQAQMLGGLSVSPQSGRVGEPVTVTAVIDVTDANYCGFIVFFGDGTSVDGVIDLKNKSPFVVSHTYTKPGQYTLNMGGRSVQSHPNCGGSDKSAQLSIAEAPKTAAVGDGAKPVAQPATQPPAIAKPAAPTAANVCASPWKLVAKSFVAKSGAFSCSAKAGTPLPAAKAVCTGDLTYFENVKKGQFGCRP